MTRTDAVRMIRERHPQAIIVASNGLTAREVAAVCGDSDPPPLLLLGAMGLAPAVAHGLSLVRPDVDVVCVEGDGNAAMSGWTPGIRYVLDNDCYETTGGQPVPGWREPPGAEVLDIDRGKSDAPRPPPPEVIIERVRRWLAR
jgi:thiamine pyrophosphate-dependent acetolactate synthase large subunit-like protein